jgi:hexosaminidase
MNLFPGVRLLLAVLLLAAPIAMAAPPPDASAQSASAHVGAPLSLIPEPASLQMRQGAFVVDARTGIVAHRGAAETVARQFAGYVQHARGIELSLRDAGSDRNADSEGSIEFRIDPRGKAASPEAYALDATPQRIVVSAADERGLFYGAVTLWQLMTQDEGDAIRVPALHIDDAPRFAWRGLMLDSARHFQGVDEIKQLLDAMALHKLNTFHWHLTDDQGWRIEIRKYPKLTSVGGCRIPAGDGGIGADGKPAPYCGYYTQAQIRDVVHYAAERHIQIVPEIDVPGHATAAIAAYPQLGVGGKPLAVSNEWGVNTNLFNVEDGTFHFLEDVLAEVIELFPGPYVHIGGDEAVKDQWESSPRVQARMRELGARTPSDMQGLMVKRLETFLVAHHRRLIGWDEILESDPGSSPGQALPAEATVMSWRGAEGGLDAVRKGHDVVMSPSSELYFDYLQTAMPDEPPGRPAIIPLRQAYAYEPVPDALTPAQRAHVIGVQANTWTEHMRSFARMEHAIFPRIAAVAETGWSPRARKNYDDFLARLPAQLQRYRRLGIDYARTPFEVAIDVDADRVAGTASVALSNPTGYRDIRYTTDGSAPTAASPAYTNPLALHLPADVRAAVFFDGQPLAPASQDRIDATSLLSRSDEQLAMCTDALMLRLEDDGPREGARKVFKVDIFNPCWEWKAADLRGIAGIRVRAGHIPYFFQLAHDEPSRKFRPATTPNGELHVRAGCDGDTLAEVPLPARPDADGFVTLDAKLPANTRPQDLCIYFTGDTRPSMWVLDRVTLEADEAPGR